MGLAADPSVVVSGRPVVRPVVEFDAGPSAGDRRGGGVLRRARRGAGRLSASGAGGDGATGGGSAVGVDP